jgi:hypothetical protein
MMAIPAVVLHTGFRRTLYRVRHRLLNPPLTKRQIFVAVTLMLTGTLLLTQLVPLEWRYGFVVLLSVMTYCLSAYALREDLDGVEWGTLLTPITLFSAAIALFYFLLPTRWLTRIPVAALYAIGIYALLLTNNIYNVAASRTIALLRAARSVGYLLTLTTFYLLILTVLSQRSSVLVNVAAAFGFGAALVVPSLWSATLEPEIGKRVKDLSIVLVAILAQFAWLLSFWPAPVTMVALTLTSVFYSGVGMAQEYLAEKLYKKTIVEFLVVNVIVFIVLLLTTSWRS